MSSIGDDRLRRLQELLDRQDILDALKNFTRGMDRFDREEYLAAFHEDATIAAGPFVGGPAAMWDWSRGMHEEGQILTHHDMLNHHCEIDGDTAHTETYYLYVARNRDESMVLAGGRYIDRLERRDGVWRIATRANIIEWATLPPAIPLPFADVPDLYANGESRRDKNDISYRRPLTNLRARTH